MGCPGLQESILIIFVLAVIFGAGRLPMIGEALGRSIRNFKKSVSEDAEIDVTPKDELDAGEDGKSDGRDEK